MRYQRLDYHVYSSGKSTTIDFDSNDVARRTRYEYDPTRDFLNNFSPGVNFYIIASGADTNYNCFRFKTFGGATRCVFGEWAWTYYDDEDDGLSVEQQPEPVSKRYRKFDELRRVLRNRDSV